MRLIPLVREQNCSIHQRFRTQLQESLNGVCVSAYSLEQGLIGPTEVCKEVSHPPFEVAPGEALL
jgi:hypothetical protein